MTMYTIDMYNSAQMLKNYIGMFIALHVHVFVSSVYTLNPELCYNLTFTRQVSTQKVSKVRCIISGSMDIFPPYSPY